MTRSREELLGLEKSGCYSVKRTVAGKDFCCWEKRRVTRSRVLLLEQEYCCWVKRTVAGSRELLLG